MPTKRKPRSDSVAAQVKLARTLVAKIASPLELNKTEQEIFDGLLEGRPQESWDTHEIRTVAKLAKLEAYMEALINEVLEEGPVVYNDKGTPVSNPKQTAMTTLASTVKMTRSSLGLTASQRGVSKTSQAAQKDAEKKTREAISAAQTDDLLA